MKTYFSEQETLYDGTQLNHLFGYLKFKVLGDSVVAWIGPCEVSFANMADGEDLLAEARICGDRMVHFIVEKFELDFFGGVALQRLLTSLCIDVLKELSPKKELTDQLRREGDDIFIQDQKLSISIAKKFVNSVVIHFAVNVTNSGTPVRTLALDDLGVEPSPFAKKLMDMFAQESASMVAATQKVL